MYSGGRRALEDKIGILGLYRAESRGVTVTRAAGAGTAACGKICLSSDYDFPKHDLLGLEPTPPIASPAAPLAGGSLSTFPANDGHLIRPLVLEKRSIYGRARAKENGAAPGDTKVGKN